MVSCIEAPSSGSARQYDLILLQDRNSPMYAMYLQREGRWWYNCVTGRCDYQTVFILRHSKLYGTLGRLVICRWERVFDLYLSVTRKPETEMWHGLLMFLRYSTQGTCICFLLLCFCYSAGWTFSFLTRCMSLDEHFILCSSEVSLQFVLSHTVSWLQHGFKSKDLFDKIVLLSKWGTRGSWEPNSQKPRVT